MCRFISILFIGLIQFSVITVHAKDCELSISSYLKKWGTPNPEWQLRAPRNGYQILVSPTDSLGVWLEKRSNHSTIELLRVSPEKTNKVTLVRTIDNNCQIQHRARARIFNKFAPNIFTDWDLEKLMRKNTRGLIYIWSPDMPLSILGIKEIQSVALRANVPVNVLLDPHATIENARKSVHSNLLDKSIFNQIESFELLYRMTTLHFPALVFYEQGQIIYTLPGYKDPEAYLNQISSVFEKRMQLTKRRLSEDDIRKSPVEFDQREVKVEIEKKVSTLSIIDGVGQFFQPVPYSEWVAISSPNRVFSLQTKKLINVGGTIDLTATPDGKFLMHTDDKSGSYNYGVKFYTLQSVENNDPKAIFYDPEFSQGYSTAGLLHSDNINSIYRVIGGFFTSPLYRDYEYNSQTAQFKILGEIKKICTNLNTSLPMISKDGQFVALVDNDLGLSKVFAITNDGQCNKAEFDLGYKVSKMAFSLENDAIAFATTAIIPELSASFPSKAARRESYLYHRKHKKLINVSQRLHSSRGGTFPTFLAEGKMLLLENPTLWNSRRFLIVKVTIND